MSDTLDYEGIAKGRDIVELRTRDAYEGSLFSFVKDAWPWIDSAEFKSCWAIEAFCDHLELVTFGYIKRLLVNYPPRCSKTNIVSVCWPAWTWARSQINFTSGPQVRFLCASYNDRLSLLAANKTRRLLLSPFYQRFWGSRFSLQWDQNTKCLIRGTQITMADCSQRSIENVKPGEFVLSYDLKRNKLVPDKVVHVWSNGIKPTRKIKLSDGTSVVATLNHRFYSWDDWLYVGDMKIGQPIAVAGRMPQQYMKIDKDDAFLLALWLAEGGKSDDSFAFTNADPQIVDRVYAIAARRGWGVKRHGKYTYHLTAGKNVSVGSPMQLLKDYFGSVETYRKRSRLVRSAVDQIRIPARIMAADDGAIKEFLSTYIACDGCVVNGANHGVFIATASKGMALDLAMLMKRFGADCSIRESKAFAVKNGVRTQGKNSWRVGVFDRVGIISLRELVPYSKQAKFRDLLEWCYTKRRHTGSRCPTIPPHHLSDRWSTKIVASNRASKDGDRFTFQKIHGGLSWRKIVSVENVGSDETWHMQTEQTSLFFANGMLSHNTQFDNTQGGSRIATSVRGGLLGLGGDIIDVDDPHNTETERVVESDADRNRVSSWSQELFSTRLNDPKKSAIVLTMQRLHEGDLSGVVLDEAEKSGEDWVHLMIPMRYDESRHCVTVKLPQYEGEPVWEDPRGEIAAEVGVDGQLMWEERFGEAEVVNLEQRLGPYMAAGRLQQRPTPKGGGILMRDWWKPWDEHEAMRYGLTWSESLKEFPHFELVWGSLDTAYKEKEENDFNALTIWGLWMDQTKTPRLMLMYAWAKRLKLHGPVIEQKPGEAAINYKQRQQAQWGLIEWIADTMKRYKAQRLLIEDKARGYDVASEINRLYAREKWDVQLLEPVGDKVSRGHAVVPCFTDGAIWAPFLKGYPIVWAEAVIKNCEVFPKATHDDLYDTVTQSVNWARENGLILRGDEVSAALEDESKFMPHQPTVAEHYGV